MERGMSHFAYYRTFCRGYKLIHIKDNATENTMKRYRRHHTAPLARTGLAMDFRFVHSFLISRAAVRSPSCCWIMPGRTHLRRVMKTRR
ncbi:hypothetical protein KCP74_21835 [Salmonella enterica subsp. enterica]|nr:hypothetical protein KCP74_21835 [Salmonella enterica subsp. enterica]